MNRNEKTLRVGIIGCGAMSPPAASAMRNLNLYFPNAPYKMRQGMAFVRHDAAAKKAESEGWTASRSLNEVIENSDVVNVITANRGHRDATLAALAKGRHVYLEKPLAHNLDDAYEIKVAADKAQECCTATNFLYTRSPAVVYARFLVESGALGDLCFTQSHYFQCYGWNTPSSWRDFLSEGGGVCLDISSHCFSVLNFVTGVRPVNISARTATHIDARIDRHTGRENKVEVDDTFTASFDLPNGAVGSVTVSRNAWGGENQHGFYYAFSKGALRWSYDNPCDLEVYFADGGTKLPNGITAERGWTHVDCDRKPFYCNVFSDGHRLGYRGFTLNAWLEFIYAIDALESGRKYESVAPIISFSDAYEVQRCCAAALLSSKEGRRITVADVKATGEN